MYKLWNHDFFHCIIYEITCIKLHQITGRLFFLVCHCCSQSCSFPVSNCIETTEKESCVQCWWCIKWLIHNIICVINDEKIAIIFLSCCPFCEIRNQKLVLKSKFVLGLMLWNLKLVMKSEIHVVIMLWNLKLGCV